jgi:hypothetical protein
LEELRAFLTSVLVTPARSRNWIGWIRYWATSRSKSGPVIVAQSDAPAATRTSTSTTTGIVK